LEWRISSPSAILVLSRRLGKLSRRPPPLGEGRSVAFPPPEPEIVQVATTLVPEPELTVEVYGPPYHWTFRGNCAIFGKAIARYSPSHVPSLSLSDSERRGVTTEVIHTTVVPPMAIDLVH